MYINIRIPGNVKLKPSNLLLVIKIAAINVTLLKCTSKLIVGNTQYCVLQQFSGTH